MHFRTDYPTEEPGFANVHVTLEQGAEPRLENVELSEQAIAAVVTAALREDVGDGDLTTEALVPADEQLHARSS